MDELFEKLKEYLHMDTEIPFEEFSDFYQSLINELNANYAELSQDSLLKSRYTCSIVQANADSRARKSKTNAKAYRKMASKCAFWADAINYRLLKEGMSQAEIDQATEEINKSV